MAKNLRRDIKRTTCSNKSTWSRQEPLKELRTWEILKGAPDVLLHQIRYAIVAGRNEHDPDDCSDEYAIMMTHDDQAYVIGDNSCGQLGIDKNEKYVKIPTKVDELSGLGIIGFSASWTNVAAWTKDGKLFMMGDNTLGKLGQGHANKLALPQQVLKDINVKVVKAACGASHIICVTTDGNVYAWGEHGFGPYIPRPVDPVTTPTQIKFPTDAIKIVDVACTRNTSFALTDDGNVYAWGCNEAVETCVALEEAEEYTDDPTKIPIPNDEMVLQIACGHTHCITLTNKGTLFVWGCNDDLYRLPDLSGQGSDNDDELVTGNQEVARSPVKVNLPNVANIYASTGSSTSVCQTLDGKIFAWGPHVKSVRPKLTEFKSINDCFVHYAMDLSQTWVSKYSLDTREPDCISFLKEQAEAKKITFLVEGTKITAPKSYLKRCAVIQKMMKHEWKQELETSRVVKIPGFKAKHFRIFINFLRLDRIVDATDNDLIDLFKLAHFYKMEKFRFEVIDMIKMVMSVGNVVQFYVAAVQHNDKTLHWDTISFIKPRILGFLGKVNLTDVDPTILVKLLAEVQALGVFPITNE